MKTEHLHLLIHEEIYSINSLSSISSPIEAESSNLGEQPNQETKSDEGITETPLIPVGFYHTSNDPSELRLLKKIIDACKIDSATYQIFGNGLQKYVSKKAIVFTSENIPNIIFYQSIRQNEMEILYSRPLTALMQSQEDKAKFWKALQTFIIN